MSAKGGMKEVEEQPSVWRKDEVDGHDHGHCRCYQKEGEENRPLIDDVETVTLQKSTYFSRVSNEVSRDS